MISLISFSLLPGCGDDGMRHNNLAPRILVFEAESDIVIPGNQISIALEVVDLEEDPLILEWTTSGGIISGNTSGAIWTAPEKERRYQIKVSVSDGQKSTTSTIDVRVWRNRPGDYYPLAVGNTWTYRDEEDNKVIFEIIDKIEINLVDGSMVESFVLQKSSLDEDFNTIKNFSYLGKKVNADGAPDGIVQHAQNITPGTEDTILFSPFLPLYNFPLIPGIKWMIRFKAELVPELFPIGGGLDEFEVISEDTVTVPAGTFDNVFQVQESFRWTFFEAQDLDVTVVQKWLAPDIGIIKFTQVQTRANVTVEVLFELESFALVRG